MTAAQRKTAVLLLTTPALCYAAFVVIGLVSLLAKGRDVNLPPALGFTAFGIGLMAFLCSVPALLALRRSGIQGWAKFVLLLVHLLWLVVGGGLVAAMLVLKVFFLFFSDGSLLNQFT